MDDHAKARQNAHAYQKGSPHPPTGIERRVSLGVIDSGCGPLEEAVQIIRGRSAPVESHAGTGEVFVGRGVGGYDLSMSGVGGGGDDQVVGSPGSPLATGGD